MKTARLGMMALALMAGGSGGCAPAAVASKSHSPAEGPREGLTWAGMNVAPELVPISLKDAAASWTQAGGAVLQSAPDGPRVAIAPSGIWVDGRLAAQVEFRAGAILPASRGTRWATSPRVIQEVHQALAASRRESTAGGSAPSSSEAPWTLMLDHRASVALVVAVVASAHDAGYGQPTWVAEGPNGSVWSTPVHVGAPCPEQAMPPIAPRTDTREDDRPHRYAVATAAAWGPCSEEDVRRALQRQIPLIAQCEAAAVESAPLLRDEVDHVSFGVVVGKTGKADGLYLEARFGGADRGLIPCVSDKLRSVQTAPVARRCLINGLMRFEAGNSGSSVLERPAATELLVQMLHPPLTWAAVALTRRGLSLHLGHGSDSAGCPEGGRLFAHLEDVRPSTLQSWLDDIVGSGVAANRVDLAGDEAMPIGSLFALAPPFWSGSRTSAGAVVWVSLIPR